MKIKRLIVQSEKINLHFMMIVKECQIDNLLTPKLLMATAYAQLLKRFLVLLLEVQADFQVRAENLNKKRKEVKRVYLLGESDKLKVNKNKMRQDLRYFKEIMIISTQKNKLRTNKIEVIPTQHAFEIILISRRHNHMI